MYRHHPCYVLLIKGGYGQMGGCTCSPYIHRPAPHCRDLIVELCSLDTVTAHCHKPEKSNPHPQSVSLRSFRLIFICLLRCDG
jgi:hypothetical protein